MGERALQGEGEVLTGRRDPLLQVDPLARIDLDLDGHQRRPSLRRAAATFALKPSAADRISCTVDFTTKSIYSFATFASPEVTAVRMAALRLAQLHIDQYLSATPPATLPAHMT